MAFFAILYLKSYKEFSTSMPVRNPIVIEWLSTHKLKRKIRVHQSDRFSVPLTFGVLSPIILVPKNMDWNNNTQTYFVLEHEFELVLTLVSQADLEALVQEGHLLEIGRASCRERV